MGSKANRRGYRVLVEANGDHRQILSITENSNKIGTLIIGAMPAANFRSDLRGRSVPVRDRKYSIHPNTINGSINTIHVKVDGINGTSLVNDMTYTKAIKENKCFAPIFARACPDPRSSRYKVRAGGKNKEVICIGSLNPDQCTLFYLLLVSPSNINSNDNVEIPGALVTTLALSSYNLTIVSNAVSTFRSGPVGPIMDFDMIEGLSVSDLALFYQTSLEGLSLMLAAMYRVGIR